MASKSASKKQEFERECGFCGALLEPTADYCPECGTDCETGRELSDCEY